MQNPIVRWLKSLTKPVPTPFLLVDTIIMELSRNLKIESVGRLQPTPARCLDAASPVGQAVEELKTYRVGCILVTDAGKLVGIFTERDLLTKVLAPGVKLSTPIRECMVPNPVTVSPNEPVRVAIHRMQEGGYRHLPVVDDDHRPTGILSAKRIIRYIVEHFPATVYNHPPEPANNLPSAPEGA